MENNSLEKKMQSAEKPNPSKSLIRSRSHSKKRLKIPVICNARNHMSNSSSNTDDSESDRIKKMKKKRWEKFPRNLFPRKMGSMICNVFGKKKSVEGSNSESISLKEILEMEDKEKKGGEMQNVKVKGLNYKKIRRVKSGRNGEIEVGEEKSESQDEELCKKRILMGGKCKPLNASGALHYDKNGVYLPEDVLPWM